jgi:hypothetical protein
VDIQNNFYYAAYSYLDEWMSQDSQFHKALAFESIDKPSLQDGARELVRFATYYGVIRTLKDNGEQPRLRGAYEALQATELPTPATRVNQVLALTENLQACYGSRPLSAATKFLWIRFRSPIIICDSLASEWLWKKCGYRYDGYESYCEIWAAKYAEYENKIREACAALTDVKKFTLARNMPDEQLSELTSSAWFAARVFDHFLITERSLSEPTSFETPPPQSAR